MCGYRPRDHYEQNATLREVIDFIAAARSAAAIPSCSGPIVENLLNHDPFLLLADYQADIDAQDRVNYGDPNKR